MTAALQRPLADAAGGGRAGTLKDIMTAQYARLAQALEDVIARLIQDTEVLLQAALPLFCVLRLCLQALHAVHSGRDDSLRLLNEVLFDEFLLVALEMKISALAGHRGGVRADRGGGGGPHGGHCALPAGLPWRLPHPHV